MLSAMKRATLSAKREVHICRSAKRAARADENVRAKRADFFMYSPLTLDVNISEKKKCIEK